MTPRMKNVFDNLFFTSIATSLLAFYFSLDRMETTIASSPEYAEVGFSIWTVLSFAIFGLFFYVILWFLMSRFNSKIAAWFMAIIVAAQSYGAYFDQEKLAASTGYEMLFSVITTFLWIAALLVFFFGDSKYLPHKSIN